MLGVGRQCLTFSGWHFRDTVGIMGPWLPKAVLGRGSVLVQGFVWIELLSMSLGSRGTERCYGEASGATFRVLSLKDGSHKKALEGSAHGPL